MAQTTITPAQGGTSREFGRAYSDELLFDKNEIEGVIHVQDAPIVFSVASSGHITNSWSFYGQRIQTDGVNTISFEGFNHISNISQGEILDEGTYQFIFWRSPDGTVRASLMLPSSEVANLTTLATPANFEAVPDGSNGDTELDLSWDAVTNVSSYELDYSVSGGSGPWIALATPGSGDTTYAHTGLSVGTTYHYRLRAIGDQVSFANSNYTIAASMTEDAGDVTAPVATFTPADAATDIPMNRQVVIDFDEAIRDADGTTEITNANVLDYLIAKEDNISGSDISITATISVDKRQILIDPVTSWGETQAVFIQVDGIEDVNGNEAAAQDATFTTNDYTDFAPNHRLIFGDILDTVFTPADSNFEFEIEIDGYEITGINILFAKDGGTNNTRTILLYIYDDGIRLAFGGALGLRNIEWANVLDGNAHKINVAYNGAIDTNNGLDRGILEIDDVVETGKTLVGIDATLPTTLVNTTNQLAFGVNVNESGVPRGPSFFAGLARNLVIRSNSGATVEISVPNLKEGTDTSGNARHGTFV